MPESDYRNVQTIPTPKLVVITAQLSGGKTDIAEYLEKKMNFDRYFMDKVCMDHLGKTSYNTFWNKNPDIAKDWGVFLTAIENYKRDSLSAGRDLVIEYPTFDDVSRKWYLDTSRIDADVEKYLIFLKSRPDVLDARDMKRNRDLDVMSRMRSKFQEPDENNFEDCVVLTYENNTPEELERIKADLFKRFG